MEWKPMFTDRWLHIIKDINSSQISLHGSQAIPIKISTEFLRLTDKPVLKCRQTSKSTRTVPTLLRSTWENSSYQLSRLSKGRQSASVTEQTDSYQIHTHTEMEAALPILGKGSPVREMLLGQWSMWEKGNWILNPWCLRPLSSLWWQMTWLRCPTCPREEASLPSWSTWPTQYQNPTLGVFLEVPSSSGFSNSQVIPCRVKFTNQCYGTEQP